MPTNLLSPRTTSSSLEQPIRPRRAGWPVFKILLLIVGIFLVIAAIKFFQIRGMMKAGGSMRPPASTVTSATVTKGEWAPMLSAVGTINPVQGATISAELPGIVSEIGFESGTPVEKGQLLVKLDASAEQAQLRSAQADAELAKADFERARDLAQRKVISTAELDAAAAKYTQRQAAVDNIQSIIDKKEIRAPFAGIAGIREVNPGQMVQPGDKLLTLQALDRVYVDFALPQQQLSDVTVGLPVLVTTDAIEGREFEGKLTAINSAVDPATRTVALQATLDNPDRVLRAGMFARARVVLPAKQLTLYIPETAVAYAPYGNSVYLIEQIKDEKSGKEYLGLRQQFIRTGEARGDFVAVTEGLKEGDQVVSTGVFKLRNKMPVVVDNKLAPDSKLNPTPPNT